MIRRGNKVTHNRQDARLKRPWWSRGERCAPDSGSDRRGAVSKSSSFMITAGRRVWPANKGRSVRVYVRKTVEKDCQNENRSACTEKRGTRRGWAVARLGRPQCCHSRAETCLWRSSDCFLQMPPPSSYCLLFPTHTVYSTSAQAPAWCVLFPSLPLHTTYTTPLGLQAPRTQLPWLYYDSTIAAGIDQSRAPMWHAQLETAYASYAKP